jgi:hypothetical protein
MGATINTRQYFEIWGSGASPSHGQRVVAMRRSTKKSVSRQGSWKNKDADHGLAAAFVAEALLVGRDQPVSLLQKSDRLAGCAQRVIIYARPHCRQSPVSETFGIVARLDQNLIDLFEPGALLQGPQTDLLELRGRPDLASNSFTGHCVSSIGVFLNSYARAKSSFEN